jgi:hypothetical protein
VTWLYKSNGIASLGQFGGKTDRCDVLVIYLALGERHSVVYNLDSGPRALLEIYIYHQGLRQREREREREYRIQLDELSWPK